VSAGRLITVEGIDGAGKTTLVGGLGKALAARGVEVVTLREPGGVPLSERIRALLREPSGSDHVDPRAEALLYAAARAQLTTSRLQPLLQAGTWVLLDRFVDSSLAYQGGGRGLGVEAVRAVNMFATGGLVPDRTLLLEISPPAGRVRQRERQDTQDRIEGEDDSFFDAVADTYRQLAGADRARIRCIDATEAPDRVLAAALEAIADLLPATTGA
jgi:dTMP kinase